MMISVETGRALLDVSAITFQRYYNIMHGLLYTLTHNENYLKINHPVRVESRVCGDLGSARHEVRRESRVYMCRM